jgi:hypothetical protein
LDSAVDLGRFTGSYRSTRRSETTLEKLQELFAPVRVRTAPNDLLHISGLAGVQDSLWAAIEPLVFRNLTSPDVLAFREDDQRQVTHLFEGNVPSAGYTRLPWYGAPELHYGLLGISIPLFTVSLVGWAFRAWGRRGRGASTEPSSRQSLLSFRGSAKKGRGTVRRHQDNPIGTTVGVARGVTGILSLVNLLFLGGMVGVIAQGRELLYGPTPLLWVVLLLPLVSTALTAAAMGFALIAWRCRYWSLWGRLNYTLVTLVGIAFLASLHYWNLLGNR